MSDRRWQTGLRVFSTETGYPVYWHRSLYRYIFEFLTKVVGWDDIDSPDAGWDSVAASGVDGVTHASLPDRFSAASASFALADVDKYLTITGMAAPNEERNGIYQIKQVISSTEVVVHIKLGVHSDGLPLSLSGLSWRLWSGVTHRPAINAVAVVAGTGTTGAGLTNAQGPIGASSFSFAAGTVTLTDAGATFQASDVGKSVVIANATTPGNDGTFVIVSRVSATQITYANGAGATEAFGGSTTWRIRYKYHVRLQVYNAGMSDPSYIGYFDHSPWETWNAVSHAWNDTRHTGTVTMVLSQPANLASMSRLWALGDLNSVTFWVVIEYTPQRWARAGFLIHFGEIDTFYPDLDPRPVVNGFGYQRYAYDTGLVGTGYGWESPLGNNVRMMSWDEVTALTAYLMFPHTAYASDQHWLSGSRRRQSEYSKKLYRMPLIVESRTAGHMELRGTLRHLQYIPQSQATSMVAIGAAHDWIHMNSGIVMPWHGGKQWYEYTGRSGGGYGV